MDNAAREATGSYPVPQRAGGQRVPRWMTAAAVCRQTADTSLRAEPI
jgi:hypothetical protein